MGLATVQRSHPDLRVQLLKCMHTQSDVIDTLEIGTLKLLSRKGQSHDVSGIWLQWSSHVRTIV